MTSLLALAPLALIVAGAIGILLLASFFRRASERTLPYVGLAALLAAGAAGLRAWDRGLSYFGGRLALDGLAIIMLEVLVIAGIFVLLMSLNYIELRGLPRAEFLALLLLAVAGGVVMVSTPSLLVAFLGLEILSVSSYALTGLHFRDPEAAEAAAKYFLLGSLASGFFVFGLAMVYGASGGLDFSSLSSALQSGAPMRAVGFLGLGFLLAALGFKVALVPFHMWTPDVYQGAATPVAALFSIGPKAAGFAVLVRILAALKGPSDPGRPLLLVLGGLAGLTMVVANLAALRQDNLKRLLAYSSIAHAGYAGLGLLARDQASVVFYLVVYLFMSVGAFAVVAALSREETEFQDIGDLAGLGFKYPWLGAFLSLFLLSLAGFPPLGGFLAKFAVFSAAVRQDLIGLAVVGVLASLVSVYYYLRVIVFLYMREPSREVAIRPADSGLFLVLFLCLFGILQLGLNPGNILALIRRAVLGL